MTIRCGEWLLRTMVEFHGFRSLVFLAVMCVSQSPLFHEAVSKSRFSKLRNFRSRDSCFVNDVSSLPS